MTPNEAKKLVAAALNDAGLNYTKLTAKTISFEGLGYGRGMFVKPIGLELPDPRVQEVKAALKGTGVILKVPQIVAPGYIVE